MRLIDADKLKRNSDITNWDVPYGCSFGVIDRQPTINPYEWISVEDRLPSTGTEVIVAICDDRYDNYCRYTSSGWIAGKDIWIVDNEVCQYVTHWMPLPAPPEDN